MSEKQKGKSRIKIVNRIAAKLLLGDTGKMDNFFLMLEDTLTRENEGHERNILAEKFDHETISKKLKYNLKDAEDLLVSSFEDVDIEKITTNNDAEKFMNKYLINLKNAKNKIKSIKKEISDNNLELARIISNIQEEIDENKESLNSIFE